MNGYNDSYLNKMRYHLYKIDVDTLYGVIKECNIDDNLRLTDIEIEGIVNCIITEAKDIK